VKRPQTYLFSSLFGTREGSPLALDSDGCCLEVDICSLIGMMEVLMSVCVGLRMKRCSHPLRTPCDQECDLVNFHSSRTVITTHGVACCLSPCGRVNNYEKPSVTEMRTCMTAPGLERRVCKSRSLTSGA